MTWNMAGRLIKGFDLPAYNASVNANKKKTVCKFEAVTFLLDETSKQPVSVITL